MRRAWICALLGVVAGCAAGTSFEPLPTDDAGGDPDVKFVDETKPMDDAGTVDDLGVPGFDVPISTSDATMDAGVDAGSSGCRANVDCMGSATPVCDSLTRQCVQCLPGDSVHPCARGSYCAPTETCVTGCSSDLDCLGLSDGGPPLSCNVTHQCVAPACSTDDNCPLGNVCRAGHCAAGCTVTHGCVSGSTCCAGSCYDLQRDPQHCGSCAAVCSNLNATPTCVAGACRLACAAGYGDCDALATNGCEASLMASLTNCGACGTRCTFTHGMGACAAGGCVVTSCETAYQDCDHNGANGCESHPDDDPMNCGRCGNVCGMGMVCTNGTCACPAGQVVCHGACANTQSDPLNCGMCNLACPSGMACVAGMCSANPLYHGWACPIAGCSTSSYSTTAATNLGGRYPYNIGDSNACRAWKLAATVCTTQPTLYTDTNNWQCPVSGGFTDPVFGTFCRPATTQYVCSTCPGACNASCSYNPLSIRNCSGSESAQP